MRFKLLCLSLLAVGLFTGCSTSYIEARGESEICEIHHTFMRTEDISGMKQYDPPSREYLAARTRWFVHSYPFYLPFKPRTRFVIYICDDCVHAEQEWKRQHPQQHQ